MNNPILSIVIPTRPGYSEHWLSKLLSVQGDVEFILIHYDKTMFASTSDNRCRQLVSPIRGEVSQRLLGLMNSKGKYVLSLNCDQYVHPEVAKITEEYFNIFPDSWTLRPRAKSFKFGDKEEIDSPWEEVPNINDLKGNSLFVELPIAPLDNKFDISSLFKGRKEHKGRHLENFDKKVWRNDIVQESLSEIPSLFRVAGPFKYIPFWCLDRFLGLYIQAKFYEKGKKIGHWLPQQLIRIEGNPPEYKQTERFYISMEMLLLKKFARYGYIWNLVLSHIGSIPRIGWQYLVRKLNFSKNS